MKESDEKLKTVIVLST